MPTAGRQAITSRRTMETSTVVQGAPARRLPLFFIGVLLFFAGFVAYAIQMSMHRLTMPWYIPISATAGVLLMLFSAWQRRSIVRGVFACMFLLACGSLWYMALVGTRTPQYAGPAQ